MQFVENFPSAREKIEKKETGFGHLAVEIEEDEEEEEDPRPENYDQFHKS